jgi:metallophosphoesterase (TIGR00282 family)
VALRVIMLGDIVGRAGRLAVTQQIPRLREQYKPHLIIANAENAANGSGLTPELYGKLCAAGIDAMTLGDHVYRKKQIVATLESQGNIIRPANLAPGAKGRGWMRVTSPIDPSLPPVFVITVLGRLFINLLADDPFAAVDRVIASLPQADPIVIVEIHAEATSEKQALAWYLNGRVSAVIGTHTHVPTADARVLPGPTRGDEGTARPTIGSTAYITDLGMCGPHQSVLGRRVDRVLTHMTTSMPAPFDVAEGDPRVNGVCIDIDPQTRRALAIERVEIAADTGAPPFTAS